jgi:hypothetical protein
MLSSFALDYATKVKENLEALKLNRLPVCAFVSAVLSMNKL